MVLVGEVAPEHWWERVLFNRRGGVVARHVGRHTRAVVSQLTFRLERGSPAEEARVPARTGGSYVE